MTGLLVLLGALAGVALCLGAQRGRQTLLNRRAAKIQIERNTRWAERRLYDISHRAFGALLEEARRSHGDEPWST